VSVGALCGSGGVPAHSLSGATLLEEITGRTFGIDELFVADRTPQIMMTAPGRMAIVTAIGFLLLGIAILRRDRRDGQKSTQWLAVTVAVLCIANLLVISMESLISRALHSTQPWRSVHTECERGRSIASACYRSFIDKIAAQTHQVVFSGVIIETQFDWRYLETQCHF
jgi:hypothetical protein